MNNGSNDGRPLIVVDNGSSDTVAHARKQKPQLIIATIPSLATLQQHALSMAYQPFQ
jgi:hypothetical protein